MSMNYYGASINDSSTIAEKAGAELTAAAFKAVKYDTNGDVVLAGDGDVPVGIVLSETATPIAAGEDITIQIKNIGYAVAGGAIAKGDFVSAGADGKLVKAVAGKFIVGVAMTAAAKDGAVFSVDICKCGYAPAAV